MSQPKNCLKCESVLVIEGEYWQPVVCTVGKSRQIGDIGPGQKRIAPPDWCPRKQEVTT